MITAPDPITIESGFPVFAGTIIRAVFKTAVDALGVMRARLPFGGGQDWRGVFRFALTTGGKRAVILLSVAFATYRTEFAFDWAHSGVSRVAKSPAAVALRDTNVFQCRGNGETMWAIHERTADKVSHLETRARVFYIKPEGAYVGARADSGKAGARVFIKSKILREWRVD